MRRKRVLLVFLVVAVTVAVWFGYGTPAPEPPGLVPVDFDPFDPCLWGATIPHDLCV